MFFSNDDDDSDFLFPSGSSKLASLFTGDSSNEDGSGNASLTYTAPKEPKAQRSKEESGGRAKQQVLTAAPVHAYKFTDGKYESQGKLGAALLANHSNRDYKLLLYVSKQQQVTHARITASFNFKLQEGSYASLYDEAQTLWSLQFEGAEPLEQFARQVCVARACCAELTRCVAQDLRLGDGGGLEAGDSVEIKYTAHLFENHRISTEAVETSTEGDRSTRFKLGRKKVIKAWDEHLLGAQKGGRRLIISPASQANGAEGRGSIPPNAAVAYDIEIVRVKLQREKEAASATGSQAVADDKMAPKPPEEPDSKAQDQESRPEKPDKAKLMSRIAKMGQAMFPVAVADTHREEVESERGISPAKSPSPHMKPDVPAKPYHSSTHSATHPASHPASHTTSHPASHPSSHPGSQAASPLPTQSFYQPGYPTGGGIPGVGVSYPPQQHMYPPTQNPLQQQYQVPMTSQLALYQPAMQMPLNAPLGGYGMAMAPPQYGTMYAPQPQQPPPQQQYQAPSSEMVLSESRQHNTEVKATLSKVTERLDKLTDKLEEQSRDQLSLSKLPGMEAAVLLANITRVVQDNERLKTELFEKNNRIEAQNVKINELIQRHQQTVEQSNSMLEHRNDTFKLTATHSQDKVLSLEHEKVRLTTELSASVSQISAVTMDMTQLKKRELELKTQLEQLTAADFDHRAQLTTLRVQNAEFEKQSSEATSALKDERRLRKELESRLSSLQDEHSELRAKSDEQIRALSESKRRASEERRRLEGEMEEVKTRLKGEVEALREKLRQQKSSADVSVAAQIARAEEEVEERWQEKHDRLLSSAGERHERSLSDVQHDKQLLQDKLTALEEKVTSLKQVRGESEARLAGVQEELDEARVFKTKYESLRTQAKSMKDRYEERITQLEKEVHSAQESGASSGEKARQAHLAVQAEVVSLRQQLVESEHARKLAESAGGKEQVDGQVKKVMSQVFTVLKSRFKPDSRYLGNTVTGAALDTVRTVTLTLLAGEDMRSVKLEPAHSETEDEVEEEEGEAVRSQEVTMTTQQAPPSSQHAQTRRDSASSSSSGEYLSDESGERGRDVYQRLVSDRSESDLYTTLTSDPSLTSDPKLTSGPNLTSYSKLTAVPSLTSEPSVTSDSKLKSYPKLTSDSKLTAVPSLTSDPKLTSEPSLTSTTSTEVKTVTLDTEGQRRQVSLEREVSGPYESLEPEDMDPMVRNASGVYEPLREESRVDEGEGKENKEEEGEDVFVTPQAAPVAQREGGTDETREEPQQELVTDSARDVTSGAESEAAESSISQEPIKTLDTNEVQALENGTGQEADVVNRAAETKDCTESVLQPQCAIQPHAQQQAESLTPPDIESESETISSSQNETETSIVPQTNDPEASTGDDTLAPLENESETNVNETKDGGEIVASNNSEDVNTYDEDSDIFQSTRERQCPEPAVETETSSKQNESETRDISPIITNPPEGNKNESDSDEDLFKAKSDIQPTNTTDNSTSTKADSTQEEEPESDEDLFQPPVDESVVKPGAEESNDKDQDEGDDLFGQPEPENESGESPPKTETETAEEETDSENETADIDPLSGGVAAKVTSKVKDTKTKGLFDDDDDDGFEFLVSKPKTAQTKMAAGTGNKMAAETGSKKTKAQQPESDEEDYKPKPPPPPLFGSDDDEDDLDWLK